MLAFRLLSSPATVTWKNVLAGTIALGFAAEASALSYSVDLNEVYSGTAPSGLQSPWLRATFEDIDGGRVRLTMEAPNLVPGEFVGTWSFNLNPAVSVASIFFDLSTLDPGEVVPSDILHNPSGQNYKAGPEKYFDIQFANPTANKPSRFTAGETLIYDVGLIGGTLRASDFLYVNQQKSGSTLQPDDWYSAAHIQGIAGGKSAWVGAKIYYANSPLTAQNISVPDNGRTLVLFAGATAGLFVFGIYRKREKAGQPSQS